MNLPTILVASLVAIVFACIVVKQIRDRKQGKGGCACGGDCSACGGACHEK